MNQKLRFSTNGHQVKYETRAKRKTVRAKTDNQQAYMDAIERCDVVFCLGPAGTGKSAVAAGMAARLYLAEQFPKIKVVRPAVEVGHSLGFLPGDLDDKIHPYLRPVLEELADYLGAEELKKLRQGDCPTVEFGVLQYMRGINFKDSFVIMDEAQNATFAEMKMFLTRLSYGSRLVINGDPTQSDLPPQERGALEHYAGLYGDFEEVGVIHMSDSDCIRHPLVRKMLEKEGKVNDR